MAPCATIPSLRLSTSSTLSNSSQPATPTSSPCGNGMHECEPFTMTEHMADWMHYTQALAALWPVKAGLAVVAAWFSTEPTLLYWLVAMWCADLGFGLTEAFKRGKFSCRILKRGALKIPAYCLYVIMVAAVDACMEIAFHMELPVLEAFLAYLVAQESVSVMGHMIRLGLPVPPMVRRILLHGKMKIEKNIDNLLDDNEEIKKD